MCTGEAPEINNYFVAAGMNSSGIAGSSGVGWALSHWIKYKRPPFDLWTVDIRRFAKFHNNLEFIRERSQESLSVHYTIPYPRKELQSGRGLRWSPLATALKKQGAVFGFVYYLLFACSAHTFISKCNLNPAHMHTCSHASM
jgi:hypothetical protein